MADGDPFTPVPRPPLSPYLVQLFIDDLLDTLNNGISRPALLNAIAYADNVQILAIDHRKMKDHLYIVHHLAVTNEMIVGIPKCGYQGPCNIRINQTCIPNTQLYRYLGFPMRRSGIDFEMHIRSNISKAFSTLNKAAARVMDGEYGKGLLSSKPSSTQS
jgi:hypothetical protein